MKKLFKRFLRLWNLNKEYDSDMMWLKGRIANIEERVGERTTVHGDLHFKTPHQIIAVGHFKNHDYVRIFELQTDNFEQLVRILQNIEKKSFVGFFDTPNRIPWRGIYPEKRF